MSTATANPGGLGRPAAATPENVLTLAREQFIAGHRVDVRAIASQLGLGRTTIYRWYGSRDGLIGAIMVGEVEHMLTRAEAETGGTGGERVLNVLDYVNRRLAGNHAFRQFLEQEQRVALQITTSGAGPVQPKLVAATHELIQRAIAEDGFQPRIEPETLAYALIRLGEAFLYDDAVIGIRNDVDRFRHVAAALIGVDPKVTKESKS